MEDKRTVPEASSYDASDWEIIEVQPVILGGSPTDPSNKVILNRQQHIEAVRYWNRLLRELRRSSRGRRVAGP